MSNDELANLLENIIKMRGDLKPEALGYVRMNSHNHLNLGEGGLPVWDSSYPEEKLIIQENYLSLPDELKRYANRSLKHKLRAVKEYIFNNFEYGSIDPSKSKEYWDFMDATVKEKKAICSSANTYAAILLDKLGVHNVRYATGFYSGGPHAWLEVNMGDDDNPKWMIYDSTPPRMDNNLKLSMGGAVLENAPALFSNPGIMLEQAADPGKVLEFLPEGTKDLAGLLFKIAALSALVAAGHYGLSKIQESRAKKAYYIPASSNDKYGQKCMEVRDLLRVSAVIPSEDDKIAYSGKQGILSVPACDLDRYDSLRLALRAVPEMGLTPKEALKKYDGLLKSL